MPKSPKIKDTNHFIKNKELGFQNIAKLISLVSMLSTSASWHLGSLTPET